MSCSPDRTTGSGLQNCAAWRQFPAIPPIERMPPLGMSDHAPHWRQSRSGGPPFDQQAVDGVGLLQSVAFVPQGSHRPQIRIISVHFPGRRKSCTARPGPCPVPALACIHVDSVSAIRASWAVIRLLHFRCSRWGQHTVSPGRGQSLLLSESKTRTAFILGQTDMAQRIQRAFVRITGQMPRLVSTCCTQANCQR